MNYHNNGNPNALVSGITVSKQASITQKEYYDEERGRAILSLVLLLMGAYGFIGALLTDFGIKKHNIIIYLLILVLCFIFSVVFYFQDYIKYTMPATLLIFIVFVALFYRMINVGYHKTFSLVVEYLNDEYQKNFTAPIDLAGLPYDAEMILFLLTITFLICWILSVWVIYRPRASFLFLFYTPILFVEAITGMTPHPLFLGLILFCVLATSIRGRIGAAFQKPSGIRLTPRHTQYSYLKENEAYHHGIQFRSILYQGALLLISVVIIFAVSIFPANALIDANQDVLQRAASSNFIAEAAKSWATNENNPLSFLFTDRAIGGIGDGTLGNVSSVQYSGKDDLVVATPSPPENTLYLKAFVGEAYGKNRWTPSVIEEKYYDQFAASGVNSFYDHNMYYQMILDYASPEYADAKEIQINNIDANDAYSYIPYFSRVQSHRGDLKAMLFMDVENNYNAFTAIQNRVAAADDIDFADQYIKKVLPEYLQLPDTGLERLEKQCQETGYYGMEDINEINQYIIDTLHSTTEYSLSPGALPRGEDFTEYFLYEQKEGFCTHYATAATLMYRMFGIPARYVMGYTVPPYLFQEQDALGQAFAVVKAERAHAWAEIYLKGIGWVPMEVTPGDIESGLEGEAAEESDLSDETAATTEQRTRQPLNQDLLKVLSYLIPALIVLLLLLVVFYKLFTYRRQFSTPDMSLPNEGIKQIYVNLYQIFIFAGLSKSEHLSESELFTFVQEKFSNISADQFSRFMDLVLEANYSNHKLTEDDIREAASVYDNCYHYFYDQLSWLQKMRFKLLCPVPK